MRKRNKRFSFLALCLSAIMLLGALPLSAGAWSEPDWRKVQLFGRCAGR